MRYRLRTLLIAVAIAPPVLAWLWLTRHNPELWAVAGFSCASVAIVTVKMIARGPARQSMLRYKLRTLLIVLALGPPVLGLGWRQYMRWKVRQSLEQIR